MALRWLAYHSPITQSFSSTGEMNAIVLGASALEQVQANLDVLEDGPLPRELVAVVEGAWASATTARSAL